MMKTGTAPAAHMNELRAFARHMRVRRPGFRKIGPRNRAAERVLEAPGPASKPSSDLPGRTSGPMMPRAYCRCDSAAQIDITPGTNLAAFEAMRSQETFTRAQVAYLVALAYESGLAHGRSYDEAEMLATWAEKHTDPPTRADRKAAEMAAYGPVGYHGGPVDFETGQPVTP